MSFRIKARISLLSTENGGLNGPIDMEPRCPLFVDEEYHDCRIHVGKEPIYPGQTRDHIVIEFLCPELVAGKLTVGKKFKLWDRRFFAEGLVTERDEG
ncbi:MAG: hypothetical protein KC777_09895 [Cyanobacteria bacterium HKST-UBA02]|nr:hypothetical protein [Cyanobacteria bacterium HKST-UBA02]